MLGVVYMRQSPRIVFKTPVGAKMQWGMDISQFPVPGTAANRYPIWEYIPSVERKRRKGRDKEEITLILD